MFQQFISFLGSPWFNFISCIIGSLGTLLRIKYNRRKKPVYFIKTTNIIEKGISSLEGLKITYHESAISSLSFTDVFFWNNGKETINRNDISSRDLLRIELESDGEILNTSLVMSNNEASGFSAKRLESKKVVLIDFDFLDYGQGGIIRVYHTETAKDITVKGYITGAKRPKEASSAEPSNVLLKNIFHLLIIVVFGGFVILGTGSIFTHAPLLKQTQLVLCLVVGMGFFQALLCSILIKPMPNDFDIYK